MMKNLKRSIKELKEATSGIQRINSSQLDKIQGGGIWDPIIWLLQDLGVIEKSNLK